MELITGGLLDNEINRILKNKNPKTTNVEYLITVHTVENDIGIQLVNSIDTMRDYNSSIGDYILASFIMGAGDFIKLVQPNRDNAEITITKKVDGITVESKRYKKVIINNVGNVYGSIYTKLSRDDLNKIDPIHVEAQCIDRMLEGLRTINVDGIYRNTTLKNLMVSLFKTLSSKIKLEGRALDVNINITNPNNDLNYTHVNVPTGTKLMDLPTFLQDTQYGVYNGAIGTYFQWYENKPTIFIYPLYNETLYKSTIKKLVIYNSGSKKLNYVENTYLLDGDILKIICGNDVESSDSGENDFINAGSAIISTNPNLVTERNAKISDTGLSVYKDTHMTGQSIKERRDGVNNETYLGMDANTYKHRSAIVKATMAFYNIPWRFSDIDLIYPGMPVSYTFEDEVNGIVNLTGTVQGVFERYSKINNTTSALLNIAVIKPAIYLNQ